MIVLKLGLKFKRLKNETFGIPKFALLAMENCGFFIVY